MQLIKVILLAFNKKSLIDLVDIPFFDIQFSVINLLVAFTCCYLHTG